MHIGDGREYGAEIRERIGWKGEEKFVESPGKLWGNYGEIRVKNGSGESPNEKGVKPPGAGAPSDAPILPPFFRPPGRSPGRPLRRDFRMSFRRSTPEIFGRANGRRAAARKVPAVHQLDETVETARKFFLASAALSVVASKFFSGAAPQKSSSVPRPENPRR